MQRTLFTPGSPTGGAALLSNGPKRKVHITVITANQSAYFAHSRRELQETGPANQQMGFPVTSGASAVTAILHDWKGELWAAGSIDGVLVDIQEDEH